jgi:hypothetical protein
MSEKLFDAMTNTKEEEALEMARPYSLAVKTLSRF